MLAMAILPSTKSAHMWAGNEYFFAPALPTVTHAQKLCWNMHNIMNGLFGGPPPKVVHPLP